LHRAAISSTQAKSFALLVGPDTGLIDVSLLVAA
jgi:hypothetical protein